MFYLMTKVFNRFFIFLYSCVLVHKDEGIKVLNELYKTFQRAKPYNIYFLKQIYVNIYVRIN